MDPPYHSPQPLSLITALPVDQPVAPHVVPNNLRYIMPRAGPSDQRTFTMEGQDVLDDWAMSSAAIRRSKSDIDALVAECVEHWALIKIEAHYNSNKHPRGEQSIDVWYTEFTDGVNPIIKRELEQKRGWVGLYVTVSPERFNLTSIKYKLTRDDFEIVQTPMHSIDYEVIVSPLQ